MEEKKVRQMSPKGFLAKSVQKIAGSASTFISNYREYLLNSEVAYLTAPIVKQIDDGTLMPTPALQEIKDAVLAHILQIDKLKSEDALIKLNEPKEEKPVRSVRAGSKKFSARIVDGNGETCTKTNEDGEVKSLWESFDMPQRAERWIDLRLVDNDASPDWTGIIYQGDNEYEEISRVRAMGRVFAKGREAVMHVTKSAGKLSFGMKAKQSHCSFSKG